MAFNIFERWPWTSFQNLNLDWLMKAVKEAVTKADEAATSVGQFDARITQNTNAIEQLGDDIEEISGTIRIVVGSNMVAAYQAQPITGSELRQLMLDSDDLPYLVYNNEVYMLDTVSTAGDMRFSMGHTVPAFDDLVIRHIMIPAQSSNVAYSITNVGAGGGSSDVFTVIITDRGENANPDYIMDSTFDTIRSQMNAGHTPVFLVKMLASGGNWYNACGSVVATTSFIDVYDPLTDTRLGKWRIYPDNTIARFNVIVQFATLDNLYQNAVTVTPQTFTAAEKAIAKENIGIVDLPAVAAADNGKFLRVVSGAWAAATVPSAESTSFGP